MNLPDPSLPWPIPMTAVAEIAEANVAAATNATVKAVSTGSKAASKKAA